MYTYIEQNVWTASQKGMAVAVTGLGLMTITPGNDRPKIADCLAGKVDWNKVRADIVAIIESEDKRRGDGTGIGPTLVRLGT